MGLFFIFATSPLLRAMDPPTSYVLTFPLSSGLTTPSWLGQPDMPAATFATLNLPLLTPETNASLLVTVFFQEKEGGFLRITWKGTQGAQVLSENFYEGIGMSNQRSLLISPETLLGDGTLTFQCGSSDLGIAQIKLEWLESKNGAVSPKVQDLLVTPETGPTQLAQKFNGQPNPSDNGAWQGMLVTVPITDQPQRIEQGVEFSVKLDHVPLSGRLDFQEAGLPLGQHLVVWINEQRAGTVTPTVPDLADGGYDSALSSNGYVGWRNGSFYVAAPLLKTGENTILFSAESDTSPAADTPATTAPLALKDLILQLSYPASTSNAAATPIPTPPPTPAPSDATDSATSYDELTGPLPTPSPEPTSAPDISTPGDTARSLQSQTSSPDPGPMQDDSTPTPTPAPASPSSTSTDIQP